MNRLEKVYKALGDESRLRLLKVITKGPYSVAELQQVLQMGQSRVSRHLKILVDAGLARVDRQGTWSYYRVADDGDEFIRMQVELVGREQLPGAAGDEARRQECLEKRRQKAREFYQRVAPSWSSLRRELLGDGRVIRTVVESLSGAAVVADLGCGAGDLLVELCRTADRVIGVDASPAMLEQAAHRVQKATEGGKVDLRLGQLEHLPLCDGEIQAAVLLLVLHHVAEPPLVAREVFRVLEKGGRLVICDLCRHQQEWMRNRFGDQWLGFEQEQIRQLLQQAGFELLSWEQFPTSRTPLFVVRARS